jgi:hypothetical protein
MTPIDVGGAGSGVACRDVHDAVCNYLARGLLPKREPRVASVRVLCVRVNGAMRSSTADGSARGRPVCATGNRVFTAHRIVVSHPHATAGARHGARARVTASRPEDAARARAAMRVSLSAHGEWCKCLCIRSAKTVTERPNVSCPWVIPLQYTQRTGESNHRSV